MTFFDVAAAARGALVTAGLSAETAARDADLLARDCAGWDLVTWLARRREIADASFIDRYRTLVARRVAREPMAYIRGFQEFWGRDFVVSSAALIPRPETELLVETALGFLVEHPTATVVDVGTGSGCIAVTLAAECAAARFFATDISAPALDVARANAVRLGVQQRITFIHGSDLDATPRPLDLVVANPPYVAEISRPALAPEVRDHEPAVALFGGVDGWREIRRLLTSASLALATDGRLMMEIGDGQCERIAEEVAAVPGLELIALLPDLQGIDRVAVVVRAA